MTKSWLESTFMIKGLFVLNILRQELNCLFLSFSSPFAESHDVSDKSSNQKTGSNPWKSGEVENQRNLWSLGHDTGRSDWKHVDRVKGRANKWHCLEPGTTWYAARCSAPKTCPPICLDLPDWHCFTYVPRPKDLIYTNFSSFSVNHWQLTSFRQTSIWLWTYPVLPYGTIKGLLEIFRA